MTYYKDLTPYEYFGKWEKATVPVLNIGWLGAGQPFETDITSQEFRDHLFQFSSSENFVLLERGFHICEFCSSKYIENWNQGSELRGNGEIRVPGNLVLYAAPALIYHYVVEHDYKPPQEFIDAVMTVPQPGSEEYNALLDNYK